MRKRSRNRGPGIGGPEAGGSMKRVTLRELEPGNTGRICELSCDRKLRRRLTSMGIVTGMPFKVQKVAPLGDPIELKFRDCNISLRKKEAGEILVEVPCNDS